MVEVMKGAEPFAFEGNDIGVLVLHGFTGCPQSMRYVGEELHRRFGFTIVGPRLPGHGTTPQDMATTSAKDWLGEAERALNELAARKSKVFVTGLSMGGTITLLWSGLANYMTERGYDYLMGCASISMADGGHAAASLYNRLAADHLGPQEYRVFPRCPLPLAALQRDRPAEVPPLIKGYLRAGAWICGEPAWDPDFNTADLPILMPMAKVSGRYAKHYLGQDA